MSAPSKVHIVQLVKVQPNESLTSTSEPNLTPGRVIYHREANGKGYWASTQVNVLSPEITIVSDADTVHNGGRQYSQFRNGKELRDRRGLRQLHGIKWTVWELGRPKTFPKYRICHNKRNSEDWQKMFWESDKSIVAMKRSNVCGAKGLTRKPMEGDISSRLRTGTRMSTKPIPMTYSLGGKEDFLKSRERENCTHGSVRGLIVSSNYRRWL